MRKVGIYYAFWTQEWDVDFIPYISKAKKLGYDQLEINGGTVVKLAENRRKQLEDEAIKHEIDLSFGIGLTANYDVSSSNNDIRENGISFMKDMIKTVSSMGGKSIGGTVNSSWPKTLPVGEKRIDYYNRSIISMKELVKVAEDYGVILLCEGLNRFEHFLINTCEQGCEYIDEINSPYCKLLLDTFHMNIEENSISDAIRLAGERLGELHVGENNRRPVGYGNMNWKDIKKALDDIHYKGSIVQEPFVISGGQVGQDIAVWRDIENKTNLDEMARCSCKYIKDHLA